MLAYSFSVMYVGGKKPRIYLGGEKKKNCLIFLSFSPVFISTGCLQAVMTKVKGNFFKATAVNTWMKLLKTPLFTTRTVDELLWGYEDSLLARAAERDRTVEKIFGLMYKARTFLPN